ncbi:hypothetical protein [Flammeovirga sp. SJP92]|uniref:hypothetical protein n=1 Tax=Flammeovirga sp. SJP92 TaxID=1775430 RepID=UPI0012FB7FE3|nr:hypothetical protein [Flammeovirga sp. SJP92]
MKYSLYIIITISLGLNLFSCKSIENKNELPKKITYKTIHKQELDFKKKNVTGMVYSENLKSFWIQTKSENEPYLFLINPKTGKTKDKIFVRSTSFGWQGISNYENTLHIGDIGDPKRKRKSIQVYSIAEGDIKDQFTVPSIKTFSYPRGKKDAKAMVYHPKLKQFFIFTYGAKKSEVYSISSKLDKGTLKKVGEVNLQKVTDVQLSSDFSELLIVANNEVKVFSIKSEKDILSVIDTGMPIFQKRLNNCVFQSGCFYGHKNDLCLLVYNPIQNKTFYTLEQKEGYY